ncbi:MAG: RluA family pseudouridine synthase [Gammaproteobacteria bacterium]|nr:RluA family pseudouridine synthase [Gammaproteobacteria bacterium]
MNALQIMPASTSSNRVRYLEIAPEHTGQRLDNFLLRELKGAPKSLIYRILRTGEVRLNGGRVQPRHRLQTGDVLRIPPLRLAEPDDRPFHPPSGLAERLRAAVIYEDRDLLALDKPAGLAVHKGSGVDYGIIEILRALRPEEPFLELAHRLDRETSGCLMLARTPTALRHIQEAFRDGRVEKRYLALARGHWNLGAHEVNQPLRRNILRGGERMVEALDDGKPALTRFRPVSLHATASLLEVRIATGRTHQIRVHAAHIGYPLAGDDKYGDAVFNRTMAEGYGLRRLFLHAHSLNLPLGGREIAVSAPLDAELKAVLDLLGSAKPRGHSSNLSSPWPASPARGKRSFKR